MRRILFNILRKTARPFWQKEFVRRIPLLGKFFNRLYFKFSPSGISSVEIRGLQIYFDGRSGIGRQLFISNDYEPFVTRLLTDVIEEGMTVLDLGAHIGLHSLTAARQVGETGIVYAFEPEPGNLSLLRKNIEVNGFNNVTVVPKAVSNSCGKQRLYLRQGLLKRSPSLYSIDGSESIEVEVTSIDEFVKNNNLVIDIVKMDIEGAETKAIEGMRETILNNHDLNLIIEFVPILIEKSGSSPSVFLETLIDIGFEVRFIDERNELMKLVTRSSIQDIVQIARGEKATNLYCKINKN